MRSLQGTFELGGRLTCLSRSETFLISVLLARNSVQVAFSVSPKIGNELVYVCSVGDRRSREIVDVRQDRQLVRISTALVDIRVEIVAAERALCLHLQPSSATIKVEIVLLVA